jgi:hypothetical protein
MSRGVVYIAVGDRYVAAAQRSAESLKAVMPDCVVALATDRPAPDVFDVTLPVAAGDGYRAKILGVIASPFDATIMLDVDTYVADDLSEVFALLERFDMALVHAPNRVTLDLEDVPSAYPEFNTGVVAFRRNAVTDRVLNRWLAEYDALLHRDPPSKDQPSFRRVAYHDPDVRIATLTPEYNQRFTMGGFFNQSPKVLHGWADPETYPRVVEAMRAQVGKWGARAVFINGKLFDRTGRQAAEWPPPP